MTLLGLFMLSVSAAAFFEPLTFEQRIQASSLIVVFEVLKVDYEMGRSGAVVIQSSLGAKPGDKIEIWDDWRINKDGVESRYNGRDPHLEVGKRYLAYLTMNARGRLVTVQSSLDCLEVVGEKVKKEGEEGFELLADKLERIRAVVAQRQKAEHAGADKSATKPADKPPVKDQPTTPTPKDGPR